MHLIWVKTDRGAVTAQKWTMKPSDLTSGYFKDLIVQAVALPPEDHDLSLVQLVEKYGTPAPG